MKKIILILVSLAAGSSAFAVSEYYSISKSIRSLGMGGAFYGLSDDDYALFYNPAGLSVYRGGGRFNLLSLSAMVAPDVFNAVKTLKDSGGKSVQTIANDLAKYQGTPLYGGANVGLLSWMSKHFAIGIINAEPKFNFAMLGKDLDTQVDITGIVDAGAVAGYATSFLDDRLHVGASIKALIRAGGKKTFTLADIAGKSQFDIDPNTLGGGGGGIDADLGAIYELPLPKLGPFIVYRAALSLNNLLATKFDLVHIKGSGSPPQLPRMFSLGFSTSMEGWGPFENVHILLDFAEFSLGGQSDPELGARTGGFFKHVNLGVEAPLVRSFFTPRIGFHQGYLTAGFGIDLRALKLDFAWYAEELAQGVGRIGSRRLALRLQLGWGSPPPPLTARDTRRDEPPPKSEPVPPPPDDKPKTDMPPAETNKVEPVNAAPQEPKPAAPAPETRAPKSEDSAQDVVPVNSEPVAPMNSYQ